jgi:hypothetical protein
VGHCTSSCNLRCLNTSRARWGIVPDKSTKVNIGCVPQREHQGPALPVVPRLARALAGIDRHHEARKIRTHRRLPRVVQGQCGLRSRACWLPSAGKDRPPKSAGSTRLVFLLLLSGAPRACFLRAMVSYKPPGACRALSAR